MSDWMQKMDKYAAAFGGNQAGCCSDETLAECRAIAIAEIEKAIAPVPSVEQSAHALCSHVAACQRLISTDTDWDISYWNQAVEACIAAIAQSEKPAS